jgi:hypothetical protein
VLAGCSVVLGSARPVLGRRGKWQDLPGLSDGWQDLPGLSDGAALALIANDLGRPPTSQELSACPHAKPEATARCCSMTST